MSYRLRGCEGCMCHEYDHIVPFSKGGRTEVDNCQILQMRANRYKGNEEDDPKKLEGYSCSHKFTGKPRRHCYKPYAVCRARAGCGRDCAIREYKERRIELSYFQQI